MVDKSGAWYDYQNKHLGQGKENAREYLREHPEIAQEIEAQLRTKLLQLDKANKATIDHSKKEVVKKEKN